MTNELLDLSAIPAIDSHCHPFPPESVTLTADVLRDAVSESIRGVTSRLNESMLLSRIAIKGLASLLGCDQRYDAVIPARNDAVGDNYTAYIRRLYAAQNVTGLLIDPGFPATPVLDAAEFATLVDVPVWEGYRIERFFPLAGSFHGEAGQAPKRSFADVLDAFKAELDAQATRPGFVFFKSIMAYRTGLAIRPVTDAEVAAAWDEHRNYGDPHDKVVRDYLFRVTCAKAREHGVPFQLHTGHTSATNPWPNVNPSLLAPVLNEPETVETSLVLVHGGYPFCAEAGFLTSIFPNVFLDFSLMIPWASIGAASRILQTLESAPVAKVMYGSDGIFIPEMNWLGSLVGRRGIAKALTSLIDDDVLTVTEAEDAAADILHRNAERIYGLTERRPVPQRAGAAGERMGA